MKYQKNHPLFVDKILKRLLEVHGFTSDAELARHLEVGTSALGNWKSRGSANLDIVITKSVEDGINLNWLITGVGEMLLSEGGQEPKDESVYQLLSESLGRENKMLRAQLSKYESPEKDEKKIAS